MSCRRQEAPIQADVRGQNAVDPAAAQAWVENALGDRAHPPCRQRLDKRRHATRRSSGTAGPPTGRPAVPRRHTARYLRHRPREGRSRTRGPVTAVDEPVEPTRLGAVQLKRRSRRACHRNGGGAPAPVIAYPPDDVGAGQAVYESLRCAGRRRNFCTQPGAVNCVQPPKGRMPVKVGLRRRASQPGRVPNSRASNR